MFVCLRWCSCSVWVLVLVGVCVLVLVDVCFVWLVFCVGCLRSSFCVVMGVLVCVFVLVVVGVCVLVLVCVGVLV